MSQSLKTSEKTRPYPSYLHLFINNLLFTLPTGQSLYSLSKLAKFRQPWQSLMTLRPSLMHNQQVFKLLYSQIQSQRKNWKKVVLFRNYLNLKSKLVQFLSLNRLLLANLVKCYVRHNTQSRNKITREPWNVMSRLGVFLTINLWHNQYQMKSFSGKSPVSKNLIAY